MTKKLHLHDDILVPLKEYLTQKWKSSHYLLPLRMLVSKQLTVAIDFHSMKKYNGSQWVPETT